MSSELTPKERKGRQIPGEMTPEERRLHYIKLDQGKWEYPPLEPEELNPEVFRFPPNYHLRKGIERNKWEGEDIGERLTNDPNYIDEI